MSRFTDFLNLFMWDITEDSEEEFDIEKALNQNWEKVDAKLKTHITNVNEEVSNFKTQINSDIAEFQGSINTIISEFETTTNQNIDDFKTAINQQLDNYENTITNRVNNLQDSISSTQVFHKYKLKITEKIESDTDITIPCFYKVGQDVLDVYLNGEKLTKSEDNFEGNYKEVGEAGSVSNTIQLDGTSEAWYVETGDVFEFDVRGIYEEVANET